MDLAALITISQQQGVSIGEMATRLESAFNQVNACLDRHDREVHATRPLLASSPAVHPLSTPSAPPSGGLLPSVFSPPLSDGTYVGKSQALRGRL